ncbi:MAG: trypsin-like serine protease, partial [Chloroflexota bacterium]|nr:trypsin-like serine protease [Chloroflexota bacterium]
MGTRLRGLRAVGSILIAVVALATVGIGPAAAITHGSLDGDAHPYVGLMTAHASDGDYLWRCSGTLISPTVFLTAGHCTEAPAAYAVIYFDAGPIIPDPDFTLDTRSCEGIEGYPCGGGVTGEVYTHPQYDPDAFYLHDLGVVVLDEPVILDEYGVLPELHALDALKPGTRTTFTSVGYGRQRSFPDAASWKDVAVRVRMVAHPRLIQFIGDFAILVSGNANTGGQCFGDSGGPTFIGNSNVIAGVISFGRNPTCAGTGGVYRIDQPDDLNWLATFLD